MADVKLSDEVRKVLERCVVEGNVVKLPAQLARPLYEAVNKALTAAGGKWNKKAGGHAFTGPADQRLAEMLDTGVSVDLKKKFQAFYTPPELAAELVQMADVKGHFVLEPSAGGGALARACLREGARSVFCVELDPEKVLQLRASGLEVVETDFLKFPADQAPYRITRVVMNPPFTKNADCQHVRQALFHLESKGSILVAIMVDNQERKPFKALLKSIEDRGWKHSIKTVPAGAFKESGTNVLTIILKVTN